MARKKRYIPTPPAILKLTPNKPHRVERGVVVQERVGRNGELTKNRGIVMGNVPADDYSRAYGREVYVCEVFSAPGTSLVVRDAVKRKDAAEIKRVVADATWISEKNVMMLEPVGRVKKIPQICTLAMKIEKGRL
jgi:hypothetical protein